MRRWLSTAAAACVAIVGLAIHVWLNCPISPLPLHLPSTSLLNFSSNNLLQELEKLGEGRLLGPEDVYVDGDGTLYTITRDGWMKRMRGGGAASSPSSCSSCWEDWILVGGSSLLGFTPSIDSQHFFVCDAQKGLLKVGKEGVVVLASQVAEDNKIRLLVQEITSRAHLCLATCFEIRTIVNLKAIKQVASSTSFKAGCRAQMCPARDRLDSFADDVIQASDGSVYFSDASSRFSFEKWQLDFLEARPSGRLLKYDAASNTTSVVLADLAFANGVALSNDQAFVVVCETWKFRCLKHWLKGEKKGETEIFVDNLPGAPDNIKLAPDGSFWIALLQMRSKGMDMIHRSPTMKRVITSFQGILRVVMDMNMRRGAMVTNVASDGKIRRILDDSDGKITSFVTSVLEFDGHLYLGSLHSNFVGKLKLK